MAESTTKNTISNNCMEKAQDFGLNSIAFPLLSVGAYEFPKRKAIEIAIQTITDSIVFKRN